MQNSCFQCLLATEASAWREAGCLYEAAWWRRTESGGCPPGDDNDNDDDDDDDNDNDERELTVGDVGGSVAGEDEEGQETVKVAELSGLTGGPLLLLRLVHLGQVVRQGEPSEELEDALETSQREELLALVGSLQQSHHSPQSESHNSILPSERT